MILGYVWKSDLVDLILHYFYYKVWSALIPTPLLSTSALFAANNKDLSTEIQVEDRSCCRFLQEEFISSDASTGLGLGRWSAAASGSLQLLLLPQQLYLLYLLLSVLLLCSRVLLWTCVRASRPTAILMPLLPTRPYNNFIELAAYMCSS
ncbi:hypothetical protein AKJ16_DCAP15104 [Drosera capensis]